MAVYLPTRNPASLLTKIRKAIDNGKILTWAYTESGDFYHDRPQWKDKAVMRPGLVDGVLQFGIVATGLTWSVYGVYHGRLIEAILTHFAAELDGDARATRRLVSGLDSNTAGTKA